MSKTELLKAVSHWEAKKTRRGRRYAKHYRWLANRMPVKEGICVF